MYTLWVISNKPHKFDPIVSSLAPLRVSYFDGSGYPSFSSIVNSCAAMSHTENVIIMSDKVLPRAEHVEKTLELMAQGYGFVALYRFAFFGFSKELFRKIGVLDEGHLGGGFEDDDFYIRLIEADIGMWVTHTVPYTEQSSSWNPEAARLHHHRKWNIDWDKSTIKRNIPEGSHNYKLGRSTGQQFLPARSSYVQVPQVAKYFYLNW